MRIRAVFAFLVVLFQGGNGAGAETSINLDLKELKSLLKSVQKLVPAGFGDEQTSKVDSAAHSMAIDQSKEFKFQVDFRGAKNSMRVQLKKDDFDAVSIWFIANPDLITEIRKAMRTYLR